jgi:DNA-binding NarL/FixJ family response regulator
MNELKKVLIVDDHESMRDMFSNEFCPKNGFEIVGSIGNAADAEIFCFKKKPDIVILDVCTEKGASGLDAAAKIRSKYPEIKIIVTTGFGEITYASRAKEIGVHAFVYKIKGVAYYIEVAGRILNGEIIFPDPKSIPLPEGEVPFSEREMEVLRLMCKYMSYKVVADELFINEKTVRRHMENMRLKAGFSTTMELLVYVLSNGWINPYF